MNSAANDSFAQAMQSLQNGKLSEAEKHFREILKMDPKHIATLNLMGVVLTQVARFEEAEDFIRRAIEINPSSDATFYNYGTVLKNLKRPKEALQAFDKAIALNSNSAQTWNNRGLVLDDLDRDNEAIASFDRAISLQPQYAEAFYNKSRTLLRIERSDEALLALTSAIKLKPDFFEAQRERGYLLQKFHHYGEAALSFEAALNLRPKTKWLRGEIALSKLNICDWSTLTADREILENKVQQGELAVHPFSFMNFSSSPEYQQQCAKNFIRVNYPSKKSSDLKGCNHDRIRIAYVSADFRGHVVAHVTAEVFERHDRSKFEVYAFNLSKPSDLALRDRLQKAFDHFIDVESATDVEIAELIRRHEIDICIDPSGLTTQARPGIFTSKAAPVQVNWLGFPGTMGADFMDYIIGDDTIIPNDDAKFYTEKVVYLPDTYFPTDGTRPMPKPLLARAEADLPENGFVFCCFNQPYKIQPETFDLWMRIMKRVESSVLWLSEMREQPQNSLRREAEVRGVAGKRLIFAPFADSLEDHINRLALADLFLDTLPYNAHATANDTLWAGVPVLTKLGNAFAGRVAASLLKAVGLPEMIVTSDKDYEELAVKLAQGPEMLKEIKEKLARNRNICALFDTKRFTRHLEAAYEEMWRKHQKAEKPESFRVGPIN